MGRDLKDLEEGVDYYFNDRHRLVYTEQYLAKRGKCCYSGCENCPYDKKLKDKKIDPEVPQELQLSEEEKEKQQKSINELLKYYTEEYDGD